MQPGWDKEFVGKLVSLNLTYENARKVLGLVCEERMQADRIGYIRGFEDGYKTAKQKYNQSLPPTLNPVGE